MQRYHYNMLYTLASASLYAFAAYKFVLIHPALGICVGVVGGVAWLVGMNFVFSDRG